MIGGSTFSLECSTQSRCWYCHHCDQPVIDIVSNNDLHPNAARRPAAKHNPAKLQSAIQLSVESVLASQTKHLKGCSEVLSGRKVILFMSRAFILAHWTDDGNKYIAIVSETQFMLEQIVNTLLSSCQSNPALVKNTLHYTTKTLIIAPGLSAN